MRNDYDLVSFIVNKNGLELEFASDKLKNNPEIVKLACLNNGLALKYASIELRNNPEIINIAISSNNHSFKFVSNDLRNDYMKKNSRRKSGGAGTELSDLERAEYQDNAKNFFYWFPRQADYTNTNSYTDMTWNKWAYPVTTNFVRGSY